MKPLTVEQLVMYLIGESEKGHKDYVVFVTDDEEANGYHALWAEGETAEELSKSNRKYMEENNHDLGCLKDTNKAIYIG